MFEAVRRRNGVGRSVDRGYVTPMTAPTTFVNSTFYDLLYIREPNALQALGDPRWAELPPEVVAMWSRCPLPPGRELVGGAHRNRQSRDLQWPERGQPLLRGRTDLRPMRAWAYGRSLIECRSRD